MALPGFAQQQHSDRLDDLLRLTPTAATFALRLAGVEGSRPWQQGLAGKCISWGLTIGTVYGLKHTVNETRPDGSDRHSFPSGHAAIAFAGARSLDKEYRHVSPWISVAGYGVATFVAVDRVAKDRHHWYDVCAGAAIGLAATEVGYWLGDRLIKNDHVAIGFSGNRIDLALSW